MSGRKPASILGDFSVNDFFTTQEQRDDAKKEKIEEIDISLIDNFPHYPFKVQDNDELNKLKESIKSNGLLEPIIVRKKENGRYELLSGHRRKRASELLGLKTIKSVIKDLTNDEATIYMVDSNLHREKILPSEKAFAYKMKYDALKHQGKTFEQVDPKFSTSGQNVQKLSSAEQMGKEVGENEKTIRRYIHLTNLTPELLQYVDNDVLKIKPSMALSPAFEISYLNKSEQEILQDLIASEQATPSYAQAIQLHQLSKKGELTRDVIADIMYEEKPNQIPKIKFNESRIRKVLPENIDRNKIEDYVVHAIDFYKKYQEKVKSRNMER